jgi:hypothetical protein
VEGLRFYDFSATQAAGANADTLALAIDLGVYRTQIHIPTTALDVMRVTDAVSKLRPLAADFTYLCHGDSRRDDC